MQLNHKIEIDILDLFKTGRFDYIKIGQTKEWIRHNFPDPDLKEFPCKIWQYGNIEFHFNKDKLAFIFSDYMHELNGGNSLHLNKWILEEPEKLSLPFVMEKLCEEKIDFNVIHNKNNPGIVDIKIISSNVGLGFLCYDEENTNPQPIEFMLNSFCLS